MKRILLPALLLFLFMLLIPALSFFGVKTDSDTDEDSALQGSEVADDKGAEGDVVLLDRATGARLSLSMFDYVCGAVVSEMPASYGDEALKAQALCCKTLAAGKLQLGGDEYIEYDSQSGSGYVTFAAAGAKWGENSALYEEKIKNAVSSVIDRTITYDGQVIMPAYHAISSGKTESAKNVWGDDIPYLQSVESPDDTLAKNYSSSVTLTQEQLLKGLSAQYPDLELTSTPSEWISINSVSDSGSVLDVSVGGRQMSGSLLRTLLGLRSACFTVTANEDSITLDVKGYGHGAGMSQYGAGAMAANGSSYEEIIKHYYTDVEITEDKK